MLGQPRGRVVKFVLSASHGPGFSWFRSWARTWHRSSGHVEPQLEGPTTKNIQLCTRGLWGEKGKKLKSLKKKKIWELMCDVWSAFELRISVLVFGYGITWWWRADSGVRMLMLNRSTSHPSYVTMGKLLASLGLSFLIYKLRILIVSALLGGYEDSMKKSIASTWQHKY